MATALLAGIIGWLVGLIMGSSVKIIDALLKELKEKGKI